jgi:biotin synthase
MTITEVSQIVSRAEHGDLPTAEELACLFEAPLFTPEAALIQVAARDLSHQACQGQTEVHAQIGLNIAPCPKDCKFCAFAACNGVFTEATEIPVEQVVAAAVNFQNDGANAIYLMGTANYPMDRYLDIAHRVRRALDDRTVLVANVGDFDADGARALKEAGFAGVYHAVRMGEGRDTRLDPDRRLATFEYARQAGLQIGTCVEPVGPEHTTEELVEKTLITRRARPVYSGAARRIPIPGTELGRRGTISEARMAHIVAVVRLALGIEVRGNCTHEPCSIAAASGATLLWAEVGSNPRDSQAETKGARGLTVGQCRTCLREAEWDVLDGPSRIFAADA